MKNTLNFDYNNKTFQDVSLAVMNDVLASDSEGSSMDDLYSTACRYVNVSKSDFMDYYQQATKQMDDWKSEGLFNTECHELNESEMSMVVGGSFLDTLSGACSAIGGFFKEHALVIGIVVGGLLLATGVGAAIGAASCALAASAAGSWWAIGTAAVGGAITGAQYGACIAAIPASFGLVKGLCTGSIF